MVGAAPGAFERGVRFNLRPAVHDEVRDRGRARTATHCGAWRSTSRRSARGRSFPRHGGPSELTNQIVELSDVFPEGGTRSSRSSTGLPGWDARFEPGLEAAVLAPLRATRRLPAAPNPRPWRFAWRRPARTSPRPGGAPVAHHSPASLGLLPAATLSQELRPPSWGCRPRAARAPRPCASSGRVGLLRGRPGDFADGVAFTCGYSDPAALQTRDFRGGWARRERRRNSYGPEDLSPRAPRAGEANHTPPPIASRDGRAARARTTTARRTGSRRSGSPRATIRRSRGKARAGDQETCWRNSIRNAAVHAGWKRSRWQSRSERSGTPSPRTVAIQASRK